MKRAFVLAALAAVMVSTRAGASDDRWFNTGMQWYEHPCGIAVFEKYGHTDTPEVQKAYFLTQKNPELCPKVFP